MNSEYQNIFVSHVAGVGKTVLAIPALRALRHYFPTAKITVAANHAAADIFALSQTSNVILPLILSNRLKNPRASFHSLQSLRFLKNERFDLTLELQRNIHGGVARWLAQSGSADHRLKIFAQMKETLLRKHSNEKHLAQKYLELLSEVGAFAIEAEPKLQTDRRFDAQLDLRFQHAGIKSSGLLIGFHPGGGRNIPRWDSDNYLVSAMSLTQLLDARSLIFAGSNERGLAKQMVKNLPPKQALAFESAPLIEVASALARLSVFITNHSGLAHLAAALGTPVVTLSSTRTTTANSLLSSNHILLSKANINDITFDEVNSAALALISANRAEVLRTR
jgi:heptosyltransferase II